MFLPGKRQQKSLKQRKDWRAIDIRLARRLIQAFQADPKNAAIAKHEGECLKNVGDKAIVARAEGAYSERQARLYASNGGTWRKLDEKRKLGIHLETKYRNDHEFAVVEHAVYWHWVRQKSIDWDAQRARDELYEKHGREILPKLCTKFVPSDADENEFQAPLPGLPKEREPAPLQKPKKFGRPRHFKPVVKKNYRIVDIDELKRQREDEAERVLHGELTDRIKPTAEGLFLRRATVANISAVTWLRALEIFRQRLGSDNLMPGRFAVLVDSHWRCLVGAVHLPVNLSRQRLIEAVPVERRRRRAEKDRLAKERPFAYLCRVEPGLDDLKQFELPGTYNPLEFPLRDRPAFKRPLTRLPRRQLEPVIPPEVPEMVQLGLVYRLIPVQYSLLGPPNFIMRKPKKAVGHRRRKQPPDQLKLRF